MHESLIDQAVASSATYRDSGCEKAKKNQAREKEKEGRGWNKRDRKDRRA